eukprot:Anaeramoba_flamelloidesa586129_58.p2 GENE.a586129_58~~a586129_58.p2  ORF type:complete len:206 (-),score=43.20 a586129_58:1050-1667(-)
MSEEHIDDVTFENNEENIDPKDIENNEEEKVVEETTEKEKKADEKASKKERKIKAEKKLEELTESYNELNDKYLRLYSDFDNYRKRTNKEKIDTLKNASQEVVIDLLPVLDDFDRAIQAMTDNCADDESMKGIELIHSKLLNILTQKGLEPMNADGKEFDTDYHEAITNIPAPSPELVGKVVDVTQKGYLLNGKIIRFAKVVVGS